MLKTGYLTRRLVLVVLILLPAGHARGQFRSFEKVSEHCYFMAAGTGLPNVGAIVTEDGIVVINPPAEPDLMSAMNELKKVSPKPVRWIVCTDRAREPAGGVLPLSRQGALVITSAGFRKALLSQGKVEDKPDASAEAPPSSLAFTRQLRIFADSLEIRIQAPEREWHPGGDVVIFIPAEKVMMVGDLYSPGSFPAFGYESGQPSAAAWLDALKQVIEMVPLLKPAMPAARPEIEGPPEEPKKLEELVAVIPVVGPPSNLQEMKDLLASAQKVRADVARAVAQKRNRETLVDLPMFGPYRGLGNLDSFATRLFDELQRR